MEERQRAYRGFLELHANKSRPTSQPTAHVLFHKPYLSPAEPLIAMDIEDVKAELDTDSELVRWLLHQMTTYDCTRERIVGLIFDRQTVLSDVLRMPRDGDPDGGFAK